MKRPRVLLGALLALAQAATAALAAPVPVASHTAASAMLGARLAEPLVRTHPTTAAEDAAAAAAVAAFERRSSPDDFAGLTSFLARYPTSGWASSVGLDLGLSYLHAGYYSRALAVWRTAWEQGKDSTDRKAKPAVDRAFGELVRLEAQLGRFDEVAALFAELARPISGSATEAVQQARELLVAVKKDPRHLYNCGPLALRLLQLERNPRDQAGAFLPFYRASPRGTSLAELGGLSQKAGLAYRLIRRAPGSPIPTQGVMHLKLGHYAAIVGEAGGRYRVEDTILPGLAVQVTEAAIDSESSGYFLVPEQLPLANGWRIVPPAEAAKVWGKGPPTGGQPGDAGDSGANGGGGPSPTGGRGPPNGTPKTGGPSAGSNGGGPKGCGMCVYDIKESTVGVTLTDAPVGYTPPIGPAPTIRITYNQREDSQPATFSFYNVSPKWTLNWITYVTDDPANPGASVSRYLPGGGAYFYTGFAASTGQFAAQNDDGGVLVLASTSPITYRRQLSDGSVEIYAQSNGATSFPRNVFLSQVIDPQGNTLTLNYDSMMRLTSLTDATGRHTTFSYGVTGSPLLVTQITDPFGRSATFAYDSSGRLASITDVIGITSSMAYDANSLVNQLTTPYGVTSFAYTAPGTGGAPRFVQINDPMGFHEREEWIEPAPIPDSDPAATVPVGMPSAPVNQFLSNRDSFFWNKDAYVAAGCTPTGGCDYTKARDTHYAHVPPNTTLKSTTVESIKNPLENRIWYNTSGQPNSVFAGTYMQSTAVGRVLDDGSTQLHQYTYDTSGHFKLLQEIDPVGRVTTYTYSNQVDLAAVAQTTAFGVRTTLAQFTYNTQHRPVLVTDAAGQTTTYAYNAAGQVTSATNPLGQTTTYHYNTSGDLTSVTNANNITQASYTYDAFDRVLTFTDSEGWIATYAYDSADRITSVSYLDGTADTYAYNKLDLASHTDRLGRTWGYVYDADQRLTSLTDPNGGQTLFGYNNQGQVTGRTDPGGHLTQWAYDVEGRLTTKTYADTTTQVSAYEATTSRLHTVTDALAQVKTFTYAKDDLPTAIAYTHTVNPTPNVSFAYDPFFTRLASRTDGGGTTTFGYAPVGQLGALELASETSPQATIAYGFDALGRLASRKVGSAGAETFAYDALGRLSGNTNDLGAFTLAYLGQTGQITSRALGGTSLATTWTYQTNTNDRRLASVGTTGLSAGQSTSFAYTSNAGGFTTGVTQTSDVSPNSPPSPLLQSASYNNLNQLTNLSGQTLTYDADGNLTSDGTRTYAWDAENRLVGIGYPGQPGKATAFAYDGLGRRISISSTPNAGGTPTVTNYVWCGLALCQAQTSAGADAREYEPEGEFLPAASQALYYAPDQLGSVRRVYTSTSAPAFDYDPYGLTLQAAAPTTDFTYAGMVANADSGLYLTSLRPYDPVTGRFLARDPVGEASDFGGNLYAYVDGDLLGAVDPDGLGRRPPRVWCPDCGAPHGGVLGPLCPDCWVKAGRPPNPWDVESPPPPPKSKYCPSPASPKSPAGAPPSSAPPAWGPPSFPPPPDPYAPSPTTTTATAGTILLIIIVVLLAPAGA
jgi:RHS repeat-associated protein